MILAEGTQVKVRQWRLFVFPVVRDYNVVVIFYWGEDR
jgi:hypothetical protein